MVWSTFRFFINRLNTWITSISQTAESASDSGRPDMPVFRFSDQQILHQNCKDLYRKLVRSVVGTCC